MFYGFFKLLNIPAQPPSDTPAEDTEVDFSAYKGVVRHVFNGFSKDRFDELMVCVRNLSTPEDSMVEWLFSKETANNFRTLHGLMTSDITDGEQERVSSEELERCTPQLVTLFNMHHESDFSDRSEVNLVKYTHHAFSEHLKRIFAFASLSVASLDAHLQRINSTLNFIEQLNCQDLTQHNQAFKHLMYTMLNPQFLGTCFEHLKPMGIALFDQPGYVTTFENNLDFMDRVMAHRDIEPVIKDTLMRSFVSYQARYLEPLKGSNQPLAYKIRNHFSRHIQQWLKELGSVPKIRARATFQLCYCLGISTSSPHHTISLAAIEEMRPPETPQFEETLTFHTLKLRGLLEQGTTEYTDSEGRSFMGQRPKTPCFSGHQLDDILDHLIGIFDLLQETEIDQMSPYFSGYYLRFHELFPALTDLLGEDISRQTRERELPSKRAGSGTRKKTFRPTLEAALFEKYDAISKTVLDIAKHPSVVGCTQQYETTGYHYYGIRLPEARSTPRGTVTFVTAGGPLSKHVLDTRLAKFKEIVDTCPHKEPIREEELPASAEGDHPSSVDGGKKKKKKKKKKQSQKGPSAATSGPPNADKELSVAKQKPVKDVERLPEDKSTYLKNEETEPELEDGSRDLEDLIAFAKAMGVKVSVKQIESEKQRELDLQRSGVTEHKIPNYGTLFTNYPKALVACHHDAPIQKLKGIESMLSIAKGDYNPELDPSSYTPYRNAFLECRAFEEALHAIVVVTKAYSQELCDTEKALSTNCIRLLETIDSLGSHHQSFNLHLSQLQPKVRSAIFNDEKLASLNKALSHIRKLLEGYANKRLATIDERESLRLKKVKEARRHHARAATTVGDDGSTKYKMNPKTRYTKRLQRHHHYMRQAVEALPTLEEDAP